jgi:hypothetical protein
MKTPSFHLCDRLYIISIHVLQLFVTIFFRTLYYCLLGFFEIHPYQKCIYYKYIIIIVVIRFYVYYRHLHLY